MEGESEVIVDLQTNEAAEGNEAEADFVKVPKSDYDKLNQTLGSLKRENKDLKKPKETQTETAQQTKPDESVLLQRLEKMSLRQAGITDPDDIELARSTAKKWGVDIDEVIADDDFKVKLDRQQTARTNVQATSNVRGGAGNSQAKNTAEYWLAKGVPPTPADVPDNKTRRQIVSAFMKNSKGTGGKFYND